MHYREEQPSLSGEKLQLITTDAQNGIKHFCYHSFLRFRQGGSPIAPSVHLSVFDYIHNKRATVPKSFYYIAYRSNTES